MSKLMITAFVVAGIMALSGCMSLEERLASSDPCVKNEAEHELVQISRATGTESDRIAAINKIANRDFLYEIAMKATTNQWVAADASFDPSGYDGYQTAGNTRVYYKVTSYGPTYKRMNGKSLDTTKDGVAAFERLSLDITKTEDYKKLFELIRKAESPYVRLAVLKSVKDPKWSQTMAKELARATYDPAVQAEAFARIEPPEARFAAMAQCSVDAKTRKEAFAKLTDQKIIDDVILKTTDKALLMCGISKVSDKAALASRVFAKEFAGKNDVVDKDLILEWLKAIGTDLKGAREKLAENGVDLDMTLACLYRDRANELSDEDRRLLISGITNQEIVTRMISPPTQEELRKRDELKRLDNQISQDKKMLLSYTRARDKEGRDECLASIAESKKERDKLVKSIKPTLFVTNDAARAAIYAHADDKTLVDIAKKSIEEQKMDNWFNGRCAEFNAAFETAKHIKDSMTAADVCSDTLCKMEEWRNHAKNSFAYSWGGAEEQNFKKILQDWGGKLSDKAIVGLLASGKKGSAAAVVMLSSPAALSEAFGKVDSAEARKGIASKMPASEITAEMCANEKDQEVRGILLDRAEGKTKDEYSQLMKVNGEKLIAAAKSKSVETFELGGFYLGMAFDDVGKLVAYYYPEWKLLSKRDDDGDYVLYVPNQNSPLCFADKNGTVYQFNFGKKMLKKWYGFDVQTPEEWARAFSKQHKIDMRYTRIEKTVNATYGFETIGSAFFHQETWQYKYNSKGYRITYFGKRETANFSGDMIRKGLVDDAVRAQTRYMSADEGTLRAAKEED